MPAFAVLSWASKLIANTAQQRAAEEKTTRAAIFSELLICSIVRREFEVDSKSSKPELSHSESVGSEINTIQGGVSSNGSGLRSNLRPRGAKNSIFSIYLIAGPILAPEDPISPTSTPASGSGAES